MFHHSHQQRSTSKAYTGYRRSIDGVLETGSGGNQTNKSNPNENSSDVDVDNHTLKSTATIITQNTSSHDQTPPKSNVQQSAATSSENFLRNEQQAQAPQPAPRTRLSSQNSIPMTNGDGSKADDTAQVRLWFYL